jgi:hypothetical protein
MNLTKVVPFQLTPFMVVCVPLIFWSAHVLLNAATSYATVASIPINLGVIHTRLDLTVPFLLLSIPYAAYFAYLEPVAGVSSLKLVRWSPS